MDTSETYIKMCEKVGEIQEAWKPRDGDFFATSCSSLSYAYGGMREQDKPWHGDKDVPKLFNLEDYEVDVLTDQTTDSGYYGWGIGESFPDEDEREILNKYFIWLPRQDQLQEMVDLSLDLLNYSFYVFAMAVGALNKFISMEQLWLAFVMEEKYNKVWDGERWANGE